MLELLCIFENKKIIMVEVICQTNISNQPSRSKLIVTKYAR